MEGQAKPRKRRPDSSSVNGVRPELLTAIVLRRALGGGVAKVGDTVVDYGFLMGRYLTGTFTELLESRLLVLVDEDSGFRRVGVTDLGRARYAQVCSLLHRDRP